MSDDNCAESVSTNLPRLHGRWKVGKHDKPVVNGLQETPFADFVRHFRANFSCAGERLAFLDSLTRNYRLQYFAIAEAIVTQVAAMCVEDPKNHDNYTIQVLLKRQKKDHLIERVKKILDQVLCVDCDGHEMTMAMCIKTLRNKFICHYDNFEDYDIAGNEGVGDGKWTPDDRDVLFRVLFAYENSPVSMLVNEMSKVMDVAAQQGVDEILDGLVKSKFGDSFTKDAEVGVVAADTDE